MSVKELESTFPVEFRNKLLRAIARGWCAAANRRKEMDSDLVDAIFDEVLALLRNETANNSNQ